MPRESQGGNSLLWGMVRQWGTGSKGQFNWVTTGGCEAWGPRWRGPPRRVMRGTEVASQDPGLRTESAGARVH